jgi:hypothetical protein
MPFETMNLQRFFTKSEVITKYGVRPEFEDDFFEDCPVAFRSGGQRFFKESDVDEYFRWFATPPYVHPSRRRGGKPSKNGHIVDLALKLRVKNKTWEEVQEEINAAFPDHPKRSAESIRKLVEHSKKTTFGGRRKDGDVREVSAKSRK